MPSWIINKPKLQAFEKRQQSMRKSILLTVTLVSAGKQAMHSKSIAGEMVKYNDSMVGIFNDYRTDF